MPEFEPTREQLLRAEASHERWRQGALKANLWTPREWAIRCLQDEWLNRRARAKW